MKRLACLFLAVIITATMLSGCAGQEAKPAAQPAPQSGAQNSSAQTAEKEKVVVACWGNQMLEGYTQYLCDLFP